MARRFLLLAVTAGAVLLVCSAVALAAVRTGTSGNDRLAGTRDSDRITGRGGDDTTIGKAGNDTYYYANGWGQDTVIDSTGTDTLNFSTVTGASRAPCARCQPTGAEASRAAIRAAASDSMPRSRA
jgi:RTX calcium-binding nonapeptide repeat (4 copies)